MSTSSAYIQWDPEQIVQRLKQLAAQGKPLNTGAIQKHDVRLAGAIARHFANHDAALVAAGIDPVGVRKSRIWTKKTVLDELCRRHRDGEELSNSRLSRHEWTLYGAMVRHFGSFAEALRTAGIDPENAKRKRRKLRWTDEKILGDIRRFYEGWWEHHSRSEPPRPRLSSVNKLLVNAARFRFGSFEAAIKAAGIDDPTARRQRCWTPELIIASLLKLHGEGTPLSYRAIDRSDPQIAGAAEHHFGSVRAAVQTAGVPYVKHPNTNRTELRHWTEDLVLQSLRELQAVGEDLRYRHMKEKHQPLFWAAHCLFGSYPNAVREMGLDYWTMSQAQLARHRNRVADHQ
jgi:hypothetical protein